MSSTLPENIAVLGPGLLGGSLLLALRQRLPAAHLRAWARRKEAAEEIQRLDDKIFASTDLKSVLRDAGLVIFCTPVAAMPALAAQTAPLLEKGCVVTDAGSVKFPVVTALENVFAKTSASFIGAHPMAGSERSGLAAARADLFDGAPCILTPTLFTAEAALQTARALWSLVGAHVIEMPPEEHDRKIARISHLPHLAAAAITLAALRPDISAADCIGSGFRDTTRVASGDPGLWTGIIAGNRAEILAALQDAHGTLGELIAVIRDGDDRALHHLLCEARSLRDAACAS